MRLSEFGRTLLFLLQMKDGSRNWRFLKFIHDEYGSWKVETNVFRGLNFILDENLRCSYRFSYYLCSVNDIVLMFINRDSLPPLFIVWCWYRDRTHSGNLRIYLSWTKMSSYSGVLVQCSWINDPSSRTTMISSGGNLHWKHISHLMFIGRVDLYPLYIFVVNLRGVNNPAKPYKSVKLVAGLFTIFERWINPRLEVRTAPSTQS